MKEKKVFISYSSKDKKFAEQIAELVREVGMIYWKAPEMIPTGSNYAKEIPRAIQDCDIFLLLISKDSQDSIWVEKEIDSAINLRKMIVPVRLDEEPLNELYCFYLNNVQMIACQKDEKQLLGHVKDLLQQIKKSEVHDKVKIHNESGESEFVSEKCAKNGSGEEMELHKDYLRRKNAFTLNKAPIECVYCKAAVKEVSKGVYRCVCCGKDSYDYLQTVRRYLEENGATNAVIIERETGVPRVAINSFLKEGYLELRK